MDERIIELLIQWSESCKSLDPQEFVALAEGDTTMAAMLQQHAARLQQMAWLDEIDQVEVTRSRVSIDALKGAAMLPEECDWKTFLTNLKSSSILDRQSLEQSIAKARGKTVSQLCRLLLEKQLLTPFQIQAIAHGKIRGLRLGRYIILDRIGQGGMGTVYRARHERMNREVAIKVLTRSASKNPQAVERFFRETEAAARLAHENIVRAYDADEASGYHFIAMEYVEGRDLGKIVQAGGPLSVRRAVDYARQAAHGLKYAHENGVIHRDIKPANILLDRSGTVKLLDMGIARLEDALDKSELTQEGGIVGTVDYMAPEQSIDSRAVDHRVDQYALGCTLYFLLAGRPPFDVGTMMVRLMAHRKNSPPSLDEQRSDIPGELNAIYLRLMAKLPDERFASTESLVDALEALWAKIGGADARELGETAMTALESEIETSRAGDQNTIGSRDFGTIVNNARTSVGKAGSVWRNRTLAAAALLVVSLLGSLFFVPKSPGKLIFQSDDEHFAEGIQGSRVTIVNATTNQATEISLDQPTKEVSLPAGDYHWQSSQSLLNSDARQFSIASGTPTTISLWLNTAPVDEAFEPMKDSAATESAASNSKKQSPSETIVESEIVASQLPNPADPLEAEVAAVKWLRSVGGTGRVWTIPDLLTEDKLEFMVCEVFLGKCRFDSKDLALLSPLGGMLQLDLGGSSLDARGIPHLARCHGIRNLHLYDTAIKTSQLGQLHSIPKLDHLTISTDQVDDDFEFLRELPYLQNLDLRGPAIPALQRLGDFSQLRRLSLHDIKELEFKTLHEIQFKNPSIRIVTGHFPRQKKVVGNDPYLDVARQFKDAGAKVTAQRHSTGETIAEWDGERNVYFNNLTIPQDCQVSMNTWRAIGGLTADLWSIQAGRLQNTDEIVKAIAGRCPAVGYLNLARSDLTDQGINDLKRMRRVTKLDIRWTQVSREAVDDFMQACPTTAVWYESDKAATPFLGRCVFADRKPVSMDDIHLAPETGNPDPPIIFSRPQPFGPEFDGSLESPSLSRDGTRLVFTSDKTVERKGLYESVLDSKTGQWSPPKLLEVFAMNHYSLSLSGDATTLVHLRNPGGGAKDLYFATRPTHDAAWSDSKRIDIEGAPSLYRSNETDPEISSDGLTLIFASNVHGGQGATDLWMCRRDSVGQPFMDLTNLGPEVNSIGDEWSPTLSADGLRLAFTRNLHGRWTNYYAARDTLDSPWQAPRQIEIPLPGMIHELEFTDEGNSLIFTHKAKESDPSVLMIAKLAEEGSQQDDFP